MHEPLSLMLAAGVGLLLGVAFYGGLWWTVRMVVTSERPATWMVGSLLLRTSSVLGGFYLVGRGDARRLLVCLGGFVVARILVTWVTGRSPLPPSARRGPAVQAGNAP